MAPHLVDVAKHKAETVDLKDRMTTLRKGGASESDLSARRDALAEKATREAQARADAIDAAIHDLKAVNPRARVARDLRTPVEIAGSIATHGRAVRAALARLRELLAAESPSRDVAGQ